MGNVCKIVGPWLMTLWSKLVGLNVAGKSSFLRWEVMTAVPEGISLGKVPKVSLGEHV